jgi:hypothetical protein
MQFNRPIWLRDTENFVSDRALSGFLDIGVASLLTSWGLFQAITSAEWCGYKYKLFKYTLI